MKKKLFINCIFLCIFFSNGCISSHISKINLTEHFQQEFYFHLDTFELDSTKLKNSKITKNQFIGSMLQVDTISQDKEDKFVKFVISSAGKKIKESLYSGDIKTHGNIDLNISINPSNKNKFTINGNGNYELYDDTKKQVFFSSIFHITKCNGCSNLKKVYKKRGKDLTDFLEIEFTQIAINQFNYDDDVKIKIEKYGKKRISIAYGTLEKPVEHEVWFRKHKIGKLTITPPENKESKIIDLRGKLFIRKYNLP